MCKATGQTQEMLAAEHAKYGDMLFVDCKEGYHKGLLSKKLVAVLQLYNKAAGTSDACMRVLTCTSLVSHGTSARTIYQSRRDADSRDASSPVGAGRGST